MNKHILFSILLFLGLVGIANAQQSVFVPATTNQIAIAGTVAARTQIVAGIAGKRIYVTQVALVPAGATSAVTFTYGTGTDCATNPVLMTGVMTFAGSQSFVLGTGYGAVYVLPVGVNLCITIAAAAAPGSLAYAIF